MKRDAHGSPLLAAWRRVRRVAGTTTRAIRDEAQVEPGAAQFVPPGHFYSPIPSAEDIDAFSRRRRDPAALPGIDIDEPGQLALLEQLAGFYASMPFSWQGGPGFRYRFDNPSYSYADGIFLYSMLRHLAPRRLIEVGSGHTSALTLDTNQHFLGGRVSCTFIEPYPELLHSLLRPEDRAGVTLIEAKLQDVDLGVFDALQAGDVLFVDSTHVSKVGSDVNWLFFEVLPRLAPGVFIHVHDVFASLEYPLDWLREGRAWNEQYLLRAFLQFNDRFRIRLFGNHMIQRHADWFQARMPLCLGNPGGAFWMEKTR